MQDFHSPPLTSERELSAQKQLREAFQQLYKQKLIQIKNFYQKQNQSLKQTIQSVYKRILSDELLVTMIGDRTTSTYIEQRIQQLFAEIVSNERQIIIQKLGIQLNQTKFYLNEISKKYQKTKQDFDNHLAASYKQKLLNEQKKNQLNQQLRRVNQDFYKQSLKIKSMQQQIDEKASLIKSLKNQNQLLNEDLQKVDKNMEKVIEQTHFKFNQKTFQISSYKELAKKLQIQLQENQTNFKKIKQSLERKSQLKINQYKVKIEQYKHKMTQLLQQSGINLNGIQKIHKSEYELSLEKQWETKMGSILRDHQKLIQQLKNQHMTEKNQLERLQQNKMKELQNHYEKQLQKKIKQINQQTAQYWRQVKSKEDSVKEVIRNYQQNYMLKQEHYSILKERQELIISMKEKIEEDESQIEQKTNMIRQMQKILNNLKSQNDLQVKKEKQMIELGQELKNKVKMYEQTILNVKSLQKKSKNQQEITKAQLQKVQNQLEESKKKISQMNSVNQQTISLVKSKEKNIKQLNAQIEQWQKKFKNSQAQLQISNRNVSDLQRKQQESKTSISNLQYKNKQIEHKYQLDSNEYQYKNKKLLQDFNIKTHQIEQLQNKYKSAQQELIKLKQSYSQTDILNQKLQLQLKQYKQIEENIKSDLQSQIEEHKSKIAQKTKECSKIKQQYQCQIINLKQDIEKKAIKYKQTEEQLTSKKNSIQKLKQIVSKKLNQIRRQLQRIESQCKNTLILVNNQVKLSYKHLQNQINQCQRIISFNKNQIHLKLKQQFSIEKEKLFQEFRQIEIKKQKQFQQRTYNLQIVYKQQISQKEFKLNQWAEKAKYFQTLAYNSKEEITKLNREIQSLQRKRQKQTQQHLQNIQALKSQYNNDKNSLIAEYEDKSNLTHQEIQQLLIQIQKIKIQTENLKNHHLQQKNGLSSQLRTVQEQQQEVLMVIQKKNIEFQKINEELYRVLQNRNHLQYQLKDLWEQNQQKALKLQEMRYNNQQLSQSLELLKSKIDRLQQQNTQLQVQIKEKSAKEEQILKTKAKVQLQLKQIRQAIDRNDKFRDIRALQQMSLETQQLTNKVNQMKRMGDFLQTQNKRCLRS